MRGSRPKRPLEERLFEKADRSGGADSCWEWQAAHLKAGYGVIQMGNDTRKAHRIAWEVTNGPIPLGVDVLHRCDNPPCVNPAHLFLGTDADNVADRHGKHRDAHGTGHGMAKLTESDIPRIFARHEAGLTTIAIGREFGVHAGTVSCVLQRRTWRHVSVPNG